MSIGFPHDGRLMTRILSGRRDSNPRPRPWQGRALPTELLPLMEFRTAKLINSLNYTIINENKLHLCI